MMTPGGASHLLVPAGAPAPSGPHGRLGTGCQDSPQAAKRPASRIVRESFQHVCEACSSPDVGLGEAANKEVKSAVMT